MRSTNGPPSHSESVILLRKLRCSKRVRTLLFPQTVRFDRLRPVSGRPRPGEERPGSRPPSTRPQSPSARPPSIRLPAQATEEDVRARLERLASLGAKSAEVAHELRNALSVLETSLHLVRRALQQY